MRNPFAALLLSSLLLVPAARAAWAAASDNGPIPDAAALAALDQHAEHADPRERCYLYTQLAQLYTRLAGQQIAAGEMDRARLTLKRVEHYAELVHTGIAADPKHLKNLKNAEMMMHQASFHLQEYARNVSTDDKITVKATLSKLDQVNDELLAQVFAH